MTTNSNNKELILITATIVQQQHALFCSEFEWIAGICVRGKYYVTYICNPQLRSSMVTPSMLQAFQS